jgi:hypothetical protein
MAHEHESQRLTVEEQQRTINLAALLQANHDQTMGIDELAEIAKSYGIRSEFVRQAAQLRTANRSREKTADLLANSAMAILALLNVASLSMPTLGKVMTRTPLGLMLLILAAVSSFRRGRTWCLAWVAPLSIFVTLVLVHTVRQALDGYSYLSAMALRVLWLEFLMAAAVAALSLAVGAAAAFQKRRERERQQYQANLRA